MLLTQVTLQPTQQIASNTTAIGTLSGQVGQNSEDIAELQDSIFFSSAYSADYPSTPNRDPEDGNMYLQNLALFTYSYADATQIFCSKTDESGNVRQFTAIQAGDSIVLNEVDSPNYGRYELVTVEDVSDSYVVMNVIPKIGQGTVITGVKVAFQAFPQPGSGVTLTSLGIPNHDKLKVTAIGTVNATKNGNTLTLDADVSETSERAEIRSDLPLEVTADLSTTQDITVNGVTVGTGNGDVELNTALGSNALRKNTTGTRNTVVGRSSMYQSETTTDNTAVGYDVMGKNIAGDNNVAVGNNSLTSETGSNNVAVGNEFFTK